VRRRAVGEDSAVKVTALAGGVGAGKFLRGLCGVVRAEDVTVVVNTGDDIEMHGLHVSPDLDSVIYWLGDAMDRDRGWGRRGETFRTLDELRRFDDDGAWFGLGDLDLATHLYRTSLLRSGVPLSGATRSITERFGVGAHVMPMSDDPVTTRVDAVDGAGNALDLHFQEYWVLRQARDDVKRVRFEGVERARPAPGVLEAIAESDAVLLCPSNPIVSIDPILAVPGIADAIRRRRHQVAGVSPIVGGAPLRGMADRLLPVAGVEVTAAGVASHYASRDLLGAWVFDRVDASLESRVRALGLRSSVVDSIMVDDAASERLARATLDAALAGPSR
jgi:LPPG:FO 2-phospho-L-lactate transferase